MGRCQQDWYGQEHKCRSTKNYSLLLPKRILQTKCEIWFVWHRKHKQQKLCQLLHGRVKNVVFCSVRNPRTKELQGLPRREETVVTLAHQCQTLPSEEKKGLWPRRPADTHKR